MPNDAQPGGRLRVVVLAVIAGIAVGVGVGFALTSNNHTTRAASVTSGEQSPPPTTTTITTRPLDSTTVPATTTTTRGPASTINRSAPPTVVAPSPPPAPTADNHDPLVVARRFLAAYLQWGWSDKPYPAAAVRARCRQWDTGLFDAGLAQSSGATAATQARIASHEVDTPTVGTVVVEDVSPAGIGYDATVDLTVTKDGAAPATTTQYIRLRVTAQGGAWYVNEVIA